MKSDRSFFRGAAAGMVGGLVASWVMNEFIIKTGPVIEREIAKIDDGTVNASGAAANESQDQDDATMKAADAIVANVTGGRHLTREGKEAGGPIVHYAFGALIGAIYGGVAEYAPRISAGAGTSFGTALFAGADLYAVPALGLGQSSAGQPAAKLASPFIAHLVYGLTTDLVRRALR
jgi:hypothetical protein